MPKPSLLARPMYWGALAFTVLTLEGTGLLQDALERVGLMPNGSAASRAQASAAEALAIAEKNARQNLPKFLEAAQANQTNWDLRAVKVRIEGIEGEQQIWVEAFEPNMGDLLSGRVSDTAQPVAGVARGETLAFRTAQITDWAFVKNGRGYGYYSVHAALADMPAGQAAVTRAFLNDQPLPESW